MPGGTPAELVAAARGGDPRAVARLLSLIEDDAPQQGQVLALLTPREPAAHVIGVTGAPGVGKSTLTSALVTAYRQRDLRVGVIVIGPSSPVTGGALLGDRVRLAGHALDPGVFIRSMASRGHPGGLSRATPAALRVLEACCEVVLLETVGTGPVDVELASLVDTTVVLFAPGAGDAVQAAAAGIGEAADLLVVNQADREGSEVTARRLRQAQALATPTGDGWRPPVLSTVASRGEGLAEVLDALTAHAAWLEASGEGPRRRVARAAAPARAALSPHPEGGRFRETWRAATTVGTDRGDRATATAITYALAPGESSAWHRVRGSDELWVHQTGGRLALQLGGTGDRPAPGRTVLLGAGDQLLVAAGEWQAATPVAAGVQVVCVVSPGFDFDDFELAPG